jgi:nucleoside-diphosphate-sugar epimerase
VTLSDALRDEADSSSTSLVSVLVTGASWPLGRRVVERLRADGRYDVVEIQRGNRSSSADELIESARVDVVVHLAPGDHDALAARGRSAAVGTPELLTEASRRGTRHVVLLSSAMVYGAWPNNPVPLTEDVAVRPDFGFAFARQVATVEQLVDDWRLGASDRSVTVLRPVPAMAADGTSSLVRALAAGMGGRLGEDDVPAQFLHLDDLASAVVLAVDRRLSGIFNVAPDGHVPGSRVRSLWGMAPRLRLPDRIAEVVADLRWRFQRGPIPPGLRPYVRSPWLVSNGKLRAEGWAPTVTNEQTFVEGTDEKWWTILTPKRKQEIALGGMVVVIVAVVGVLVTAIRRR